MHIRYFMKKWAIPDLFSLYSSFKYTSNLGSLDSEVTVLPTAPQRLPSIRYALFHSWYYDISNVLLTLWSWNIGKHLRHHWVVDLPMFDRNVMMVFVPLIDSTTVLAVCFALFRRKAVYRYSGYFGGASLAIQQNDRLFCKQQF